MQKTQLSDELDVCVLLPKYRRVFELDRVVFFGGGVLGNDWVGFGCVLVPKYRNMFELELFVFWCQK